MCLRRAAIAGLLLVLAMPVAPAQGTRVAATRITVGGRVLRRGVKRFGMNLSGQSFYDSGQMLRNLVARNPGFQGETWQSIVRCGSFGRGGCTSADAVAWPGGFMDGASFEVLSGAAAGQRGVVRSSAAGGGGYALTFAALLAVRPAAGDYLVVRVQRPGNPTAGWWTSFSGGARAEAEFHDMPAGGAGRQVLRLNAAGVGERATVTGFFDSTEGHSFVRMNGVLTLRFCAKPVAGGAMLHLRLQREGTAAFLDKGLPLGEGWRRYTVPVKATDRAGSTGAVGLSFGVDGASVLLADVSLTEGARAGNGTVFRDAVVDTLRELRPGILRYMDNGTGFGSSLEQWLTPVAGRARAGYSVGSTEQGDVTIGLEEFLQLAEAVGAEPWINLPAGFSEEEARQLVEYLGGGVETRFGGIRAGLGHPAAWDGVFSQIHVELGNEVWNRGSFAGATIDDPATYGQRAAAVFGAMRSSAGFRAGRYDLVAGSFFEVPRHTVREIAALHGAEDSIAVAPYLFSHFNAAPGMEGVYGPMLAEPERLDSTPGGLMAQQAAAVRDGAPGRRLSVYEVNLGTTGGVAEITQAAIDRTVPTVGAAVATAAHMLLMLRDLGVTDQCFFALPEFRNPFVSPGGGGPVRTTPLYGAVVDMGGATDRRRPSFYALRMLNRALLTNLIETRQEGANPAWNQTWNQAGGPNGAALPAAHLLQSFAFADGDRRSVVLLNLSRTEALPVTFAGPDAPRGAVEQTVLTSAHIEDSNELAALVAPKSTLRARFDPNEAEMLPPFSLTTFTWKTP